MTCSALLIAAGCKVQNPEFKVTIENTVKELDLDKDYTFALIGSKKAKFLWILSRTPEMAQADLERVLNKARSLGYKVEYLIWVEHN
ncbi:MAG TPA: lipocalin family protein [Bacteroidales bacterium]|nr:lipocalin family protein [Bacteroidales bacterium]OQC58711.1 MAG: outer membrane lipoprotein Blc [Bacteroidetes bacterium ADurb.Bin013]MBV6455771.1 hypothetical protein [Bacteroidales bacterium]MCZ2315951.1 lipocalin family protein [Bacteroidales bacterium]NLZ08161.1 lipocalin family protein [Bacteroidales bacterium]